MGFLDNIPDLGLPAKAAAPAEKRTVEAVVGANCVPFLKVRCPKCGSDKCPVYDSAHVPYRYHKCECGWNFQSYEVKWSDSGPEKKV